jgi:ABC-type transport system involved in cytochrome c biogenesis permease subunit
MRILFALSATSALLACVVQLLRLRFLDGLRRLQFFEILAAFFALLFLAIRAVEAARPVGIGMLESLAIFIILLCVSGIIGRNNSFPRIFVLSFSMIIGVCCTLLPSNFYIISKLMPALESPLFFVHIPIFFAAYAALSYETGRVISGSTPRLELSATLQTLGIISGAIWAYIAWGFPWSWDPKESWALVTLLFIISAMLADNPKFKRSLTVLAFLAMLFTFIGIAYLFKGMHSYQ